MIVVCICRMVVEGVVIRFEQEEGDPYMFYICRVCVTHVMYVLYVIYGLYMCYM